MKKLVLKTVFSIMAILFITACSSNDEDDLEISTGNKEQTLSYESIIGKTYSLEQIKSSKEIDYFNNGTYTDNLFTQFSDNKECFTFSTLRLYQSGGEYRYEFKKPNWLDDEVCENNNSRGTFVINGNRITFTDDNNNIWNIWENVVLNKYTGQSSEYMFLDVKNNWVSDDKKQDAIINYQYKEK